MRRKEASFKTIFWVMALSMFIALFWNQLGFIKYAVNIILNPTAGVLLNWNLIIGMTILTIILTLFSSLAQKYGTNQEELQRIKKEQKEIQKKMKEIKNNPEELMQLQKEIFPLTSKSFKLSMGAIAYTSIPILLLFRWFNDFFISIGNPKILFGLNWFWFYFILTMILSTIFRKVLKIA